MRALVEVARQAAVALLELALAPLILAIAAILWSRRAWRHARRRAASRALDRAFRSGRPDCGSSARSAVRVLLPDAPGPARADSRASRDASGPLTARRGRRVAQ